VRPCRSTDAGEASPSDEQESRRRMLAMEFNWYLIVGLVIVVIVLIVIKKKQQGG
jgi:predicted nucleic acid-binding Zn ribbon protein